MVKQEPTNCLSAFNHFVGLALKGLILLKQLEPIIMQGEILAPDGQSIPPFKYQKTNCKTKDISRRQQS